MNRKKTFCFLIELLFGLQWGVKFEQLAALVEPVAVFVGGDGDPLHQRIADVAHIADDVQLLFARKVVADVVVVDAGRFVRSLRFLDQNRNGNRGARAQTENITGLFAADFTACAAVAAQIEDIDSRKFAFEAFAHAVESVGIEPCAVGDEADDTALLFVEPVRRPAEGLDITVVGRFVEGGFRSSDIGIFYAAFECRIGFVLRIVVGRPLADGIGRIADDDGDAPFFLLDDAPRVGRKLFGVEVLVRSLLAQLEGVCEADAAERYVGDFYKLNP